MSSGDQEPHLQEHENGDDCEEEFSDSADEWDAPVNVRPEDAQPLPPRRDQTHPDKMDDVERELAGDQVRIVFALPSGKTTAERSYYMGQTIEFLKTQLEELEGLPYDKTRLFLGEKQLFDPLSLNDLPFSSTEVNTVKVVTDA